MQSASKTGLYAVVTSLIVIAVIFLIFLNMNGGQRQDLQNDAPQGGEDAAQNILPNGQTPGGDSTKTDPKTPGEDPDPEEAPRGEPVLVGYVYGSGAGLSGAQVMAFPFAMIKELIPKYESAFNIGGLGDIPGLIRQIKRDVYSLRSRGVSAKANAEGRYAFYDLAPGEYLFLVTGPRHIFAAGHPTQVEPEVCRQHDFHLDPGQVIGGRVIDNHGRPVAGASVLSIYQVQGLGALGKFVRRLLGFVNGEFLRGPFESITKADGRFRIDTLPPALYELNVKADGFAEARIPNIATGTDEIVVQLNAGGTVRGALVDLSGQPLPDIPITLTASADKLKLPIPLPVAGVDEVLDQVQRFLEETDEGTQSDAEGLFACTALRAGAYELEITPPGFLPIERYFTINGDETVDLGTLVLDRGGSIRGTVVDQQGQPVEKVVVCAQVAMGGGRGAGRGGEMRMMMGVLDFLGGKHRSLTDEEGGFVISGLKRGPQAYRVVASRVQVGLGIAQEAFPDGAPVQIVLSPPLKIQGLVVSDADDKPIAGAEVLGGGSKAITDEAGRFVLNDVVPDGNQMLFDPRMGGNGNMGSIRLYARYPGLCPDQAFLRGGNLEEEVVLRLRKEPLISGVVLTSEGKPKAGAVVRLVPGRLPPVGGLEMITFGVTFSDAEGKFSFGEIRFPMECRAVASFPGYATGESEVFFVSMGETRDDLVIELVRGGRITGLVTDGKAPISGVKLRLHPPQPKNSDARAGFFLRMFGIPEPGDITYTTQAGTFLFDDVAPGVYMVTATAGAGITRSVEVTVEPESEQQVEIELDVGGEIAGVVADRAGQPIQLARVRLVPEGNRSLMELQRAMGGSLASATTDQGGAFLFSQVKVAGTPSLPREMVTRPGKWKVSR